MVLSDDFKRGSTFDEVSCILILNDNAADAGISTLAVTTMYEKVGTSAHIVACRRVKLVAVRVALVREHITERVSSLRERALVFDALTVRVISALVIGASASIVSIDIRSVERNAIEVMGALGISIRTSSSRIQLY